MNQAERSQCLKEARTPAGLKGKLSSLQKVTQSQFRKLVSLNISLELKHFFCYYYYCFCCCIWGIFKDKSAFIHIIMIKPATGNNFLHYLFFCSLFCCCCFFFLTIFVEQSWLLWNCSPCEFIYNSNWSFLFSFIRLFKQDIRKQLSSHQQLKPSKTSNNDPAVSRQLTILYLVFLANCLLLLLFIKIFVKSVTWKLQDPLPFVLLKLSNYISQWAGGAKKKNHSGSYFYERNCFVFQFGFDCWKIHLLTYFTTLRLCILRV